MIAKKIKFIFLILLIMVIMACMAVGCTYPGAGNTSPKTEIFPLTAQELSYFNGNEFFNGENMNIRNQFLSSIYDTPEKINLFDLFYNGSGQRVYPSKAEIAAVIAQNGWSAAPDCGCDKISRAEMDSILSLHTGITLAESEQIGLEKFTYLKEYDAYYHYHGDTNYRTKITFLSGEREGGTIRLFYDDTFMADGYKVLTLREQYGKHLFVSNQMAEQRVNAK